MKSNKVVFFVLGGTGGHIYPALALETHFKFLDESLKVVFVGGSYGLESEIISDLKKVRMAPFNGKSVVAKIKSLVTLFVSFFQSVYLILRYRPDSVISFGGYVSVPVVFAAWVLRKNTIIWEANAEIGLANRALSQFAGTCLSAFKGLVKKHKKFKFVGTPIRLLDKPIQPRLAEEFHSPLRVLVIGGSQGSAFMNSVLLDFFKSYTQVNFEFCHQVGNAHKNYFESQRLPSWVKVRGYIEDIYESYQWADFVICRSGALSVAELSYFHKPCLLIPAPQATNDHQLKNARFLEAQGAAFLIEQKDFSVESLKSCLLQLNKKQLEQMSKVSQKKDPRQCHEVFVKASGLFQRK